MTVQARQELCLVGKRGSMDYTVLLKTLENGVFTYYSFLLVASLWAAVKYKPFKLSHRLMSVAYLLIAFHSVLLLKHAYWGKPIYYLTVAFALAGSIAATYSLLGLVGRRNRHSTSVVSTRYFPKSRSDGVSVKAKYIMARS